MTARSRRHDESHPKGVSRLLIAASLVFAAVAQAEVLEVSDTHFRLQHSMEVAQSPQEIWGVLVQPQRWWSPQHTYSGNANNLSLNPSAGGLWRESWSGGSVTHGTVLTAMPGKLLRLDAPFGPLQGTGAKVTWTISLQSMDQGTRILFDEIAFGPESAGLRQLAPAVDQVKAEGLRRLGGFK